MSCQCFAQEAITKGSYNPQGLETPTKAGPPCGGPTRGWGRVLSHEEISEVIFFCM